jgi:protein-S-isoprenylcysteine O-methyltransferase Ste14
LPGRGAALLVWLAPKSGLLRARLNTEGDLLDLATVKDWVEAQNPPTDVTTHWWYSALEPSLRQAVARIADSPRMVEMFRARYGEKLFAVEPIPDMNEIYVASMTHRNNSDTVFYTDHIDGPFMVYPFAAVYRCIVALNENVQIRTSFPMTPTAVTLTTGDVGSFDFSREIHRIEHNAGAENPGRRITLKLHYCVYPRRLAWYGRMLAELNTRYDIAARRLFLKTLRPQRLLERLLAQGILLCTRSYRLVAEYVGGGAIAYLALLALADRAFSAPVFLYGSSFIHYLLYMAVYYTREDVAFTTFKRRAMFWKGLAGAQLVYLYLRNPSFEPLSLSLIVLGIALSGAAARVLGMERTYFAAELGRCAPLTLRRFPYNLIRHPMIVGNIIALLGFYALPGLRAAAPYLVPMHIAFYLLHLLQEEGVILRKPQREPNAQEAAG